MNAIIDAAFLRSRTILLTLTMLLICGLYAYLSIPKESDPDINIPIIYVSLDLRGISPGDAERLLIRPVEQKLRSVEGVKEIRSTGYLGGANIVLEFEAGFNADQALEDVREKVDEAKPELPEAADDPTVNEVNLSLFPIITIILSGDTPERTLLKLAKELQDEIEAHPSVLEANIGGDRSEQVEILIDPLKVESYALGNSQILSNIGDFNTLVAAGSIDTGQGGFNVKVPGLFETEEDIANMPLQVSDDAVVRFHDIADVRRTFVDPIGFAQYNGRRSVSLEVKKRTGENIIKTIEDTKAIVNNVTRSWPKSVVVDFYGDRSEPIRTMLTDLQNNVISAILLVMIIIVAALGLRSAGLVGIAIPGSFLTGILVIYIMGLTVNVVVLFSLILSVGMLVDGAIVLTEYADCRLKEGIPPSQAYAMAAKRMSWPIIASTATTLAAFLPLIFWPGVMGEFMKFLPITLIATLSASLLMALIFVPILGALMANRAKPKKAEDYHDIFEGITKKYIKILTIALYHPGKIVGGAFFSLIFIYFLYGNFGRGVELFPDIEPDFAILQIHARGNFSIHEKKSLVDEVEHIVLQLNNEKNELDGIYARSGELGQNEGSEDIIGSIQIRFGDWKYRRKADDILNEITEKSEALPGIQVETQKLKGGPPVGKAIQIELASKHPEKLEGASKKILKIFNIVGDLINIEDGSDIPGIEWEVIVDRTQAVKFDTTISFIGSSIQLITNGAEISSFRPDNSNDEIDIVARFPEKYRTINQLDSIRISTNKGNVPISNFVQKAAKPKVGTIHRTDGYRTRTIKADVKEGILANDKIVILEQLVKEAGIDPLVNVKFKGEDEEQKKAGAFLFKAFLVAMFLIMIILVTQFNSFYSAFLILSAVIMSTVGVLIGLLLTNQPFGIVMSGVGVIALAGIVVNNNIVLIDTFDSEVKTAKSHFDAIINTGRQRLRPVLLTTITTILGLMPMVLQVNIDFITRNVDFGSPSTQWWVQLATGIAYGLTFSTILTLVVTPCLLMLRSNAGDWRDRQIENHTVEKAILKSKDILMKTKDNIQHQINKKKNK